MLIHIGRRIDFYIGKLSSSTYIFLHIHNYTNNLVDE